MATQASHLTIAVSHTFDTVLGNSDSRVAALTHEEWDRLLDVVASDVVFMTWQWQSLWWKHFGAQQGCQLHLLALRDERGALVGIAPLYFCTEAVPPAKEYRPGELRPEGEGAPLRVVRVVGGIDIADYLDIIASPESMTE